MTARKCDKGFTLIEMLIAMTLLGIMVVLLFTSLKIAAESWNAGEGKVAEVNKKSVVYQFFKRHLTTIRPVLAESTQRDSIGEDASIPGLAFQGHSQSMQFVAAMPAASTRKGLQVFTIAAERAEPSTIMVTLSPYQQTEPREPEQVVLLEHVKGFAFSYFGKKDESSDAGWQPEWTGLDHLPQLIKVSIKLDDGSYWPDMVFPLKITGLATTDITAVDNSESTVP